MNVRDKTFIVTAALPDGAAATQTTGFDLGAQSGKQKFVAGCELLISAPVLTTTEAPDTKTFTYSVETDNDVAFGSAKIVADKVIVQTGAGGAGAAAATQRFRVPTDVERYVRVKCTGVATGLGATKSMTVELLF